MNVRTYIDNIFNTIITKKYTKENDILQKEAFDFYSTYRKLPSGITVQNLREYNSVFADEYDALRHTYTGVKFTQKYGSAKAKSLQDGNELRTSGFFENIKVGKWKPATSWNSPTDRNKDLWNNHVSRKTAPEYDGLNNKTILKKLTEDITQGNGIIVDQNNPNNPKYRDTKLWEKIWREADKLWDKTHNQNFSSENTGLSNSASVSNQLIQVPQNVPSLNLEYLAALGQLGQTTSVGSAIFGMISGLAGAVLGGALSSALGGAIGSALKGSVPTSGPTGQLGGTINGQTFKFPEYILKHSGGTVPGQGEIPAILMGGETVRTKPQEEELQQQLYQKYIGNFAPTVCGEQQQATQQQQNNTENKPQKPIHQQITKEDEMFILNLIADAIDRNRMGLRTKLQVL